MLAKLEWAEGRYHEISAQLSQPEVATNPEMLATLMKEHAQLAPIAEAYAAFCDVKRRSEETEMLLLDPDMAEMAEEEIRELQTERTTLWQAIERLLIPQDPHDASNVILEIRAGAGGDEASLFGAVLLRMYQRYAELHGWRTELTDASMTELGGVKEATMMIAGRGAFRRMKFESGVHRVQRVPQTESGGRIHTSTATVAVLPEAEDVDLVIGPNDLKVDVYRSSGHGGQCVNTTDSAVRMTHLPTGLVVTCQDEKSQLKNRDKALRVLKARLLDHYQSQKNAEYAQNRRAQVGTGDRSERIRTYNFPQGRVTDHRINLTLYQIDTFVDGDCDAVMDALLMADEAEKLKQLSQERGA